MKKQGKPGSEANQELTNPLKVVAGPTSANSDQSRTDVPPSAAGGQQDSSAAAHRATGPRTKAGKRRSSRNALKSGIFSKVLFLGESKAEYEAFLRDLRDDLQPQGTLETVLVDELAVVLWRKGRLVLAESAEITDATVFKTLDTHQEQRLEVWDRCRAGETAGGMLRPSTNPFLIRESINTLKIVRSHLQKFGINEVQEWLLKKLFGLDHDGAAPFPLFHSFCIVSALATGAVNKPENCPSPEELKEDLIRVFDEEIEHLERQQKNCEALDRARGAYRTLAALIPPEGAIDRFIRYEAHLRREFDRILNQLERLQRMRRGQPAPPTLRLELDG